MQTLINLSPYLSILAVWLFVVIIPLLRGLKPSQSTISAFCTKDRISSISVTLGLILGAIFQKVLLPFIEQKFNINIHPITLYGFIAMNLIVIFVALIKENSSPRIHKILVMSYFLLNPLIFTLLTLELVKRGALENMILLYPIAYLGGMFAIFRRFNSSNAYLEYYGFLLTTLWVLLVTLN